MSMIYMARVSPDELVVHTRSPSSNAAPVPFTLPAYASIQSYDRQQDV